MKNTIIIILISLFGLSLNAQENKTKRELRAEKKQKATVKRDSLRLVQEEWAEKQTFVLEAQQVYNKMGEMFSLTSSINFVYINGEKAIIQLGFNGIVGWNGVGGITIKGRISKYTVEKDNKNIPIYISLTIQGSEGFNDIKIWISTSGRGEAQVMDNRGNRIKFIGDIVSLEDTRVYIGTERF